MSYKGTTKYAGYFKPGQTIGRWVITTGEIVLNREAMVECKCECGNRKLVSAYTLKHGTSTGCKTCQNQSYGGAGNGNWKGVGYVPGYYLNSRKLSSSVKQAAADLIEEQNFQCALTGLPISFTPRTASLDRIDSRKPYQVGNMQWVHKDVNVMKNGYDLNYFIRFCKLVAQHHKSINVENSVSTFTFGNTNKDVKLHENQS